MTELALSDADAALVGSEIWRDLDGRPGSLFPNLCLIPSKFDRTQAINAAQPNTVQSLETVWAGVHPDGKKVKLCRAPQVFVFGLEPIIQDRPNYPQIGMQSLDSGRKEGAAIRNWPIGTAPARLDLVV